MCDNVALEFLSNCVLACGESGMNADSTVQVTNAAYTLLTKCAQNTTDEWPSLGSICNEWDTLMSSLLLVTDHPESSPTPAQLSTFDTWLHHHSFLSPHHFDMHRVLWSNGGISVSPPLRRIVRPIVVSPPPIGAYEPLSMAREA